MGFKEKFRRFIKRTGAFILVITLSLISLSFIAHLPAVQKFGIEHIAGILSGMSGTRVEVGKFDFNFFNHLNLYEVYVETAGQPNDTLIFSEAMEVRFSNLLSLVSGKLNVKQVALRNVDLDFSRPDTGGVSTLTSFFRNFSTDTRIKEENISSSSLRIEVNTLIAEDLHVRYEDHRKKTIQEYYLGQAQFKFEEIDLQNSLLRMEKVALSGLSVDIEKMGASLKDLEEGITLEELPENADSSDSSRPLRIEVGEFLIDNGHLAIKKHVDTDSVQYGVINYNDLVIDSVSIAVTDFVMDGLDFKGAIGKMSLIEKSGFAVSQLVVQEVDVSSTGVILNGINLLTNKSAISDTVRLTYNSYSDFGDFVNRVNIYATLKDTRIALNELMMTVPPLHQSPFFKLNQNLELRLSGIVSGNINRLRARKLDGRLGDLRIQGEFSSRNLTVPNEQLLNLKITRAVASARILRKSIPGIKLTSQYDKLGKIIFTGRFDGFFNDFVAFGAVQTNLGGARVDMRLDITEGAELAGYSGEMVLDSFDVGAWTDNQDIGTISAGFRVDEGRGLTAESANAKLNGAIQSVKYKGHVYRDVVINGLLDANYFNGDLQVIDKYARLTFAGSVDLRGEDPEFDFRASIDSIDLLALNLVKDTFRFAGDIELAGKITPSRGIEGYARASRVNIVRGKHKVYPLDTISLISAPLSGVNHYTITSDYINGSVDGRFELQSVYPHIAEHLSIHYPHIFSGIKYKRDTTDAVVDLDFDVVLSEPHYWRGLIGLYDLSFETLRIAGLVNIPSDRMRVQFSSNYLFNRPLALKELDGFIELADGNVSTALSSDSILINKFGLDSVTFAFDGDGRNLDWKFAIRNLFDSLTLNIAGEYSRDTSGLNTVQIDRDNSTLFKAGWEVNFSNRIAWKKDFVEIDSFSISKGNRFIGITEVKNRGISFVIKNFDMHYIDEIWDYEQLDFGGLYTLRATVNDIFSLSDVHIDLDVPVMKINDDPYGLLALNIDIDSVGSPIFVDVELGNPPNKILNVKGWYNPAEKGSEKNLDVVIALDTFPVKFLEYFLDGNILNTKGYLVGNVIIDGDTSYVDMNGSAVLYKGETTVVTLGTRYKVRNQKVILTKDFIDLTGTVVVDAAGNTATAIGGLYHTYLKDMGLDIQVSTNKLIGLDLPKSRDVLFYGKAVGAAFVDFQGPVKNPNLVINATTAEGTRIFIPLNDGTSSSAGTFLEFVDRDTFGMAKIARDEELISGMNLEMNLTITPGAQVDFILNEETRDIIQGRGSGDIQIVQTRTGDFSIYGGVEVESGNYLFTAIAVNKPFIIRPGGTLRWTGSPYDAQINIVADYVGLRASLSTLLEEYLINATPNAQQQARQITNVQLELLLTGTLLKPTINFKITLPDVTGELSGYVDTKIKSLEANPNALNEQVFGLLMFRTFLPSNATRTSTNSAVTVGLTNTLSEFLSSQLSFFVSDFLEGAIEDVDFISGIDFDVGYTKSYDYLDQSSTYSEWQVHMRNRLFNDRFIVDVGGSYVNDNPVVPDAYFAGDYALEYILTDDRRLKVRMYYRNEETIEGRKNKTGIGLAYRREFDNFIAWLKGQEKDSRKSKKQAKGVEEVGGN